MINSLRACGLVETAADCAGAAIEIDTQTVATNVKPHTAWREPLTRPTVEAKPDGVLTHPGDTATPRMNVVRRSR